MTDLRREFSVSDFLSVLSILVLFFVYALGKSDWSFLIAGTALVIGITTSVQHADTIAHKIGPSLGTLVLAISVTIIEVALIVSLMSNETPNTPTIARDTVFSAVMIVTNGIIGVCILIGGMKQRELGFQSLGTTALLGVLFVLSALTLILPNFTTSTLGPTYETNQLIYVSVVSILLYGALVWAQTKSHKSFFEPKPQTIHLSETHHTPTKTRAWISFIGLLCSLVAVVGLAKFLSPAIEKAVTAIGAPGTVVGVVIALLVLAPETLAALKAARIDQLQTSLNLALGSGAASIALTIPCVSIYSIATSSHLTLGLDAKGMAFLFITFLAAAFTFGNGRTTALHGIVHLTLMISYVALSMMP